MSAVRSAAREGRLSATIRCPVRSNEGMVELLPRVANAAQELGFVDHLDTEGPGLFELASGSLAGDENIGVLRHRSRHPSAVRFHELRCLLTGECGQRSSD